MNRLAARERVTFIDQLLSRFAGEQDGLAWNLIRVNTVLVGFGLEEVYRDIEGEFIDRVRTSLQGASDSALEEIHGYVFPDDSIAGNQGNADEGAGLWLEEHIRLFISHSASHMEFAGQVAEDLRVSKIHGFVAHDAIEVNREWQEEIERALRTADVFVALVHQQFSQSAWCQQEIGWAFGRQLPIFVVRLGADAEGFPGKTQWPSMIGKRSSEVAGRIVAWANSLPQYSHKIAGELLTALRTATNYYEAGAAAKALNDFDDLTPDQFRQLDAIYLENSQVHGSVLAHRGLDPLYERHHRSYPERT